MKMLGIAKKQHLKKQLVSTRSGHTRIWHQRPFTTGINTSVTLYKCILSRPILCFLQARGGLADTSALT
jgi:hypothetical protein